MSSLVSIIGRGPFGMLPAEFMRNNCFCYAGSGFRQSPPLLAWLKNYKLLAAQDLADGEPLI
jgi:hypothetical protein